MGQVVEEFEPDASPNELGVHVLLGGQVSCVPPAVVPSSESEVKRIWRELNPRFVPLWITNDWRTPNGGTTRVHLFAVGAHVTSGECEKAPIHGLLLPTTPVYGRMPQLPIVVFDILDGLTNQERNFGELQRWEPLTHLSIDFAHYRAWVDRHVHVIQQGKDAKQHVKRVDAKAQKVIKDELTARKKFNRYSLAKAMGTADRIYVPTAFGAAA